MKFLTANAHWLLRIALASVFVYHGVLKFQNLEGFAQMLPISYLQVVLVALAETAGGLLVLAGGFHADRISDLVGAIAKTRFKVEQRSNTSLSANGLLNPTPN